jgi:hypothetical protein
MNVPSVGNPLLHAATLAAQKQHRAGQPGSDAPPTPAPAQPAPGHAPDAPEMAGPPLRTPDDLEQLADDVLAIFEDSPDRLEQLVATLKRLEGRAS